MPSVFQQYNLWAKENDMKYKILFSSAVIFFSAYSHAGCVGPVVNGKCLSGTDVYGYDGSSNSDSDYKSNSGSRNQYDLGDPGDSTQYSTDLDAQRRDQMNTDSRRDLDRRSGQYGGGIYND
jgi:hypothetical protein